MAGLGRSDPGGRRPGPRELLRTVCGLLRVRDTVFAGRRLVANGLACRPGKIPGEMTIGGYARRRPLTCENVMEGLGVRRARTRIAATIEGS